jgi:alpha-mannosidase
MSYRVLLLCVVLGAPAFRVAAAFQLAQANGTAPATQGQAQTNRPILWLIPHTHWEGAVFETREDYLEHDLPNIQQALRLLRTVPDYRFVLDQAAYVKPFLERYPEEAADFRNFVAQGRLQIVGGTDVMLDSNIPSGESWIRQVLYGKSYFRKSLNVDVTTGWAIDTFGHNAQMPQLLKLAGFKSYWFQRGPRDGHTPSEFLWAGVDGTKIPAFWLPLGYGLFYPSPKNTLEFDGYSRSLWNSLGEHSHFTDRVALAGADVVSPEAELPERVKAFNAQPNPPFILRFGLPGDYEQAVARRADRPLISGELDPLFQGAYSTRIELKQWMREDEQVLTNAEKLAAVGEVFGAPPDAGERWQAWEPVLFNQAHDLTSGTMVDTVYLDSIREYQHSKDLGGGLVRSSLETIAAKIDTTSKEKDAVPVLVFNTLGWPRTDVAQAEVRFLSAGVKRLQVHGPTGSEEPVQILDADRGADGGIRRATVVFIARDVPAMGWAVYTVAPREKWADDDLTGNGGAMPAATTHYVDSGSIENEFYRATFDLWTGAMTGLDLKSASGAWHVLGDRPGNIVACEQDGGDSWELYGTLDGARFTAMTRASGLPPHDRSHFSDEWVGGNGQIVTGPVFSEFQVEHPFGKDSFSTRARVYKGIQRIDFESKIVNNDTFVRYRLLFPTSIQSGRRFDEIPFAAIERPQQHEFPAQNWMDWSDGDHGVALLNVGLPGSNVSDGTLMLSLMRSARINEYSGVGLGSSDLGLELGQQRTFHYALVPHAGSWRDSRLYQAGLEFNRPLLVRPLEQHTGKLGKTWGMLKVSSPDVVLSSLMPAEDGKGLIVRVYEAVGQAAANIRILFATGIQAASEVNLMEDPIQPLAVKGDSIQFDLRPFEIKTFRLQLVSANQ